MDIRKALDVVPDSPVERVLLGAAAVVLTSPLFVGAGLLAADGVRGARRKLAG